MNRRRAQSIVEFAFVAPLFFLLVFGLLDIGRAVWHYNTAALVARDAARQLEFGSVTLARCNAMFLEGCSTATPTPVGKVAVTVTACPSPSIQVTYTFQPIITFVARFPWIQGVAPGSGTFPISATSNVPLVPGVCP